MKTLRPPEKKRIWPPRNPARPGETPLKCWLADKAEAAGITPQGIWERIWTYKTMPAPKLRRVNRRVIFVVENL